MRGNEDALFELGVLLGRVGAELNAQHDDTGGRTLFGTALLALSVATLALESARNGERESELSTPIVGR
ncbi:MULTISPECIES: hypothetical protein [Halorussus]|uniref:hypothetical protein n=1 Tax=Halorussus TaxID=1070314 RepID=UPI00209CC6C8|nr:hypothetical protein [Halorussus vallis]USZ75957.1 hypothetical protein NGM07_01220 [Halorussus vallis]